MPWTVSRLTGAAFYEAHYMDPLKQTGKTPDLFERIRYLHPDEMMREDHLVVLDSGKPVGNIAVQANPHDHTQWWVKHVSVDPAFHNRGIASAMIAALFAWAREEGKSLKRSTPSEMGAAYLTAVFARAIALNPDVRVIAHDDHRA